MVRFRGSGKIVLIILDLVGFIAFDIVYVAAVMNYAAQSEMNIYLLRAIRKLIEDKSYGNTQLDSSIKVSGCVSPGAVYFYSMH